MKFFYHFEISRMSAIQGAKGRAGEGGGEGRARARMDVLYGNISRMQYIATFGNIGVLQYSENIVMV